MGLKIKIGYALAAIMTVMIAIGIPLWASYQTIGERLIFNLFAGDAMYYMAIANNYTKYGFPTLDGEWATNGFHPLWQWVEMAMFSLLPLSHHTQIFAVFAACIALVCVAYTTASYTMLKLWGGWPGVAAMLALFPGAYALCFEPRRHVFGEIGMHYTLNPISAINGMETPLSMALWALFFAILSSRLSRLTKKPHETDYFTWLFPMSLRLCLPAMVLCRLDDCFLLVAIAAAIMLQQQMKMIRKLNTLLCIFWPAAMYIAAYLMYNMFTVGAWLPVSATAKMSTYFNGYNKIIWMALAGKSATGYDWWFHAVRIYPVVVAAVLGMGCTLYGWRYRSIERNTHTPFRLWFLICGLFLTTKTVFLAVFVEHFHQGYWYYFSMIAVCNIMFAAIIGYFTKIYSQAAPYCAAFFLLIILMQLPNNINFLLSPSDVNSNAIPYNIWKYGDQIKASLLRDDPDTKIIDTTDGLFAYALDLPSEVTTGLTTSPQMRENVRTLGLWVSLAERGFNTVPWTGYTGIVDRPPKDVEVVKIFSPEKSPIPFYKIELLEP